MEGNVKNIKIIYIEALPTIESTGRWTSTYIHEREQERYLKARMRDF